MITTQRKTPIGWKFLFLTFFALSLLTQCKDRKKTVSMTQKLQQVRHYADSLGIDTSRFVLARQSPGAAQNETEAEEHLRQLLLEVRYGRKPVDLSFTKLPEQTDTAWVSQVVQSDSVLAILDADASRISPYRALMQQYHQVRQTATPSQLKAVRESLNFYRYLNRFDFDRMAVVNIPAAQLSVIDKNGQRTMPMEVIAGKADKQTPRFNCYLTDITAFPYWNVPEGIGVKEILPKVQANPDFLDSQNMEVLDARNQSVDPYSLNWASYSADNFPYRFRQTSGCHNALGLIKFVLNGPPAIYLHDTNARELFDVTKDRWRSHGCVRLEKPVEFANYVLGTPKFDKGFYNRCLIDQKPQTFKLPKPFPVFVTYLTADVDAAGRLVFYKDVYRLENRVAVR